MKSDVLVNAPPPQDFEDEMLDDMIEEDDYPVLEPRIRHTSSRPVTLQELINELKRAVATKDIQTLRQGKKAEKPKRKTLEEVLGIAHEEDIEKSILEMSNILDMEFAYREFVLMSELVKDQSPRGIIDTYLPLLFLANRKYITLTQEVLFDEIFIRRGAKLG
jgi:segregation and condensation protein A